MWKFQHLSIIQHWRPNFNHRNLQGTHPETIAVLKEALPMGSTEGRLLATVLWESLRPNLGGWGHGEDTMGHT